MIERIKSGTKPTDILLEIKAKNPGFRNFDLSNAFRENFEGVSSEAIQAIWYWKRGGRMGGYDDEQLDAILMKAFEEAGLL
jgi:hypothetical protein